jgi:hypothetical protein
VSRSALDSVPKFQQLGRCLGRHRKSDRITHREGEQLGELRTDTFESGSFHLILVTVSINPGTKL